VNQVISKRMVKKQQMRWTESGAHNLLQIRTKVLNTNSGRPWFAGIRQCKTNRRRKFRRRPHSPRFEMLSSYDDETRERILRAAEQLFCPRRFSGRDIREIAREAKVHENLSDM